MIKIVYIFVIISGYLLLFTEADYCTFFDKSKTEGEQNKTLYHVYKLKNKKVHTVDEDHEGQPEYDYNMCFCCEMFNSTSDLNLKNAMIVQTEKTKSSKANFTLGRFNETRLALKGHGWILLSFTGAQYSGHCNKSQRLTYLMIMCDLSKEIGGFRFIGEDKNASICHYSFEIRSKYVCEDLHMGINAAGIFCIFFFTILLSYFLFGFLYQRFVVGAKGMEQMPNFTFWHDFGNLQADGCDFICRSGSRYEPRAYKGIGDDRLRGDEEPVDDHLLPM